MIWHKIRKLLWSVITHKKKCDLKIFCTHSSTNKVQVPYLAIEKNHQKKKNIIAFVCRAILLAGARRNGRQVFLQIDQMRKIESFSGE